MKIFLYKITSFFIWFLAISFVVQQIIFFALRKINVGEIGVINKVLNGKINSEIIICGASRGYDAFDTRIISKITAHNCYNISLTGSRLGLQLPILKAYLESNKKPKIIVLEVGMYSLSFDKAVYAPYKYLPYLDRGTVYEGLLEVDRSFIFQKYVPFATFYYLNTDFQKRFIKELTYSFVYKKDYLLDGYNPMPRNPNFNQKYIMEFEKNNIISYSIDKKAVSYLKEIVEICRSKNISLIFVNPPEYYKILHLYKNRDKVISIIKNICNANSIGFLDYNENDLICEKSLFFDFTHLNDQGAKKFSEIFAYDLLNYFNIQKE